MPDWGWPPVPPRGFRFGQRRVSACLRNPIHNLTLPRASVLRSWDEDGRSQLELALEVRDSHGDAVAGIFVSLPWGRPRLTTCAQCTFIRRGKAL